VSQFLHADAVGERTAQTLSAGELIEPLLERRIGVTAVRIARRDAACEEHSHAQRYHRHFWTDESAHHGLQRSVLADKKRRGPADLENATHSNRTSLLMGVECFKATCVLSESLSADHVGLTAYNLQIGSPGPKSAIIIFIQMSQGLRLSRLSRPFLPRSCLDFFASVHSPARQALWLAARNQETNADDFVEGALKSHRQAPTRH
jgi:hypothetical protein